MAVRRKGRDLPSPGMRPLASASPWVGRWTIPGGSHALRSGHGPRGDEADDEEHINAHHHDHHDAGELPKTTLLVQRGIQIGEAEAVLELGDAAAVGPELDGR